MYTPTTCNCNSRKYSAIRITNAEKQTSDSTNSSSSTFIVYTIHTNAEKDVKRRYSEFESFRKSLTKLYPMCLVPPIPEKHSLSDYTTHKQKDDSVMIEKRKRMLERFLKRVADHPILNQEHVFHRFLDNNHTWSDIVHSPPLSTLPKDPLLSSESSFTSTITNNLPTAATHSPHNSIIPIPSSSYTLKYPDKEFEESESKVTKPVQQVSLQFEKSQKRIVRRLGDLSYDYAELGSAYNALSLNETGQLSDVIEKIGQVVDDSCTTTKQMIQSLEIEFSEHVQDYTQYIQIAKKVLQYRRLKQAQIELIEESIDNKKGLLRNLVKTEEEAQKLKLDLDKHTFEDTPHVQRPVTVTSKATRHGEQETTSSEQAEGEEEGDEENSTIDTESIEDGFSAIIKSPIQEGSVKEEASLDYPTNASAPILRASKNQTKRWSSPRKLISAVTYTIQGMIDTDPEQTRRNQIDKLKSNVEQLENMKTKTRKELKEMSLVIHQEFERLQHQKETEIRSILISFAKIHATYCEQNATSWEHVRDELASTMETMK
ncbi:hypothetical protein EDC96DRAFT_499167 [Choanephora cucurbitarum]|nr:hypothetical protein EDC96DRAFT_499167 [Choanephora cucurbitarum]